MKTFSHLRVLRFAILVGITISVAAQAQWSVSTYSAGGTLISNLADADRVISGEGRAYLSSANYPNSNTQDNGTLGLPLFGLGTQVFGLPAVDNDDFVFQARANFTVTTADFYTFSNYTNDGSRLLFSINGGNFAPLIVDDVVSGGHIVNSPANFFVSEPDHYPRMDMVRAQRRCIR